MKHSNVYAVAAQDQVAPLAAIDNVIARTSLQRRLVIACANDNVIVGTAVCIAGSNT